MNPNYSYDYNSNRSVTDQRIINLRNDSDHYNPDIGRITLSNDGEVRLLPVIRILPPHEYHGTPEEVIIHPSIAQRYRDRALNVSGMQKKYDDYQFTVDKEVGGFGIQIFLKKSKLDLVGIKLSNLGYKISSKLGKDEGSSRELAEKVYQKSREFQKISPNDLKARLNCLRELCKHLEDYAGSLPQGVDLRKKAEAMLDFAIAAALDLEFQLQSVGIEDLGRDWLDAKGYLSKKDGNLLRNAMLDGDEAGLNKAVDKLLPRMFADLDRGGATWEKFASCSCASFKKGLLEKLDPSGNLAHDLLENGRWAMVDRALNRLYAGIVNGLACKSTLAPEELVNLSQYNIVALDRDGFPDMVSLSLGTSVRRCQDQEGNGIVVKERILAPGASEEDAENLAWESFHELIIHSQVPNHENVVRLMGTYHNGVGNVLCLEDCSGGSAINLMGQIDGLVGDQGTLAELSEGNKARLRRRVLRSVFRDASAGLTALHARGISHGNPCLDTLFLKDGVVKVGNFKTGLKTLPGLQTYPLSTDLRFPRRDGSEDVPELSLFHQELGNRQELIEELNLGINGSLGRIQELCRGLGDEAVLNELDFVLPRLEELQRKLQNGRGEHHAEIWMEESAKLVRLINNCVDLPQRTGQEVNLLKSDVWMLGVAMAEAFFPGQQVIGNTDEETQLNLQALIDRNDPEQARLELLLTSMLRRTPEHRISMDEVMDHDFFHGEPVGDVRGFLRALHAGDDVDPQQLTNLANSVIQDVALDQIVLGQQFQHLIPNGGFVFEIPNDI
ncbi:hypothetical protein [Verrucomicrobium sp. BvORR106]|uniref:hypothetical protein n=1 Tax=Verrucomicrobium sp. BvORR106 TaxID=1403819 RepID=UPI0005706463|nr:hypothetical protein [Verrucomicrobium sp. BvORR106]